MNCVSCGKRIMRSVEGLCHNCLKFVPKKGERREKEERQFMTAWEKYRELYEKYRYKVLLKIHKYLFSGARLNHRKSTNSMELFILENTEGEALKILEDIEDELRK